jgi:outer membrane protein, multidrug efflux system
MRTIKKLTTNNHYSHSEEIFEEHLSKNPESKPSSFERIVRRNLRKTKNINFTLITSTMILLLSACSFAPKKVDVAAEIKIPENYNNSTSYIVDREDAAPVSWWEEFENEELNELIEKVIENNLDLQIAGKRVDMLKSQFKAVRGSLLPAVSVGGGYTKSEGPVTEPVFTPTGMEMSASIKESEMYSLRTGLGFELDIWGKLRRNTKAANESFKASKEDLNTAYLGIIAQTVILYYDIEAQKRNVEISKETLSITKQNYDVAERRYKSGIAPKESLERIFQAYGNMQTKLQSDKQLLSAKFNQLSVLLGEYPQQQISETEIETEFLPDFEEVSMGVPSGLLRDRSDIVSAAHNMEAARQQAGAAFADFFPSISLSAGLNFASMSWDTLFEELSTTKSIGGEVNEVLFAGGAKVASYKQKKAAYEQSVLTYKKTILTAFSDVENALFSLETARMNQQNSKANYESAKRIFEIMKQKYLKGTVTYSQFLEGESNMYSALTTSYNADKQLISARVQLYSALGGKGI